MKKLFISRQALNRAGTDDRQTAIDMMPWAIVVVHTGGGYMGFASVAGFDRWEKENPEKAFYIHKGESLVFGRIHKTGREK